MKNLFKPTRVTWIVFGVLFLLVPFPLFVVATLGVFEIWAETPEFLERYLFIIYMVVFSGIFKLYNGLQLPVGGWSGGWFSHPEPNVFGWVLVLTTPVLVSYIIASIIARVWYAIKNRNRQI